MHKLLILSPLLLLAACGSTPEDNSTYEPPGAANTAAPAPTPSPTPTKLDALPQDFVGRWGLTLADCKQGAVGSMVVAAKLLTFDGSRAVVSDIVQVRAKAVKAKLAYTNAKGKWASPTTMTLEDGGKSLSREDEHPAGIYTYLRCPG